MISNHSAPSFGELVTEGNGTHHHAPKRQKVRDQRIVRLERALRQGMAILRQMEAWSIPDKQAYNRGYLAGRRAKLSAAEQGRLEKEGK